ncbi:SRPBCC family protein [Paractinoplanes rishiriensis]|uniref:Activator of HSP90 ATPase n=1 Tax=Paractinoplanes rishiriensis TaxID=1050105 RepID=A0A919MW67_9ACTN|nr:SRPBCC family protein [Actinoplanes rishiriensis]GIE97149.1 activator of HSP90 ATPase [Actinoplanes rishiriensis]
MIDVRQQISAVRRSVGSRTLEAGEAKVSVISQVYDTDIDDLWEVVTTPERIGRWFLPVSGELKEGGHYQFEGQAGGSISRCDKPRGYAATWEYGGEVSWIEVRLTPEGDGTRFELEHVAHVKDEFWEQYGPAATGIGWDSGLVGLRLFLSDPEGAVLVSQEEKMAWAGSPDGVLMMRLSSEAWAEAAIAGGEDPAVAKARAERSFKAFTGAE